ncbi:MAG: phosphate acyltransferase PlsX, partial [Kiritimatiellae bacterium]|nr:phosphate acyltransferase PlsX [Kiritimatiellia bacterium]
MRIAVDAMGGDFAPLEIVKGAVEAARSNLNITKIFLVGDQDKIKAELKKYGTTDKKIEVLHASEVIAMDESPALAIRRKKDSSVGRAIDLIKQGDADAMISAGNTGAVVVAATLKLRLLEGVDRPAIATIMPTQKNPFILVDAGANIDCSPKLISQFAVMGSVYSKIILNREKPIVGLLSIGGEDIKGNETTKETFNILSKTDLNFRGNVEGHDLFEGETDVVACDGFVGNIV